MMRYDMLMRVPFLCWVVIAIIAQGAGLIQTIHMTDIAVIHLAMRLSMITFLLLLGAAVLARSPPSAKASGWEPRISALVGTFLIYTVVLFPRRDLAPITEFVSTLLLIIGSIAAIAALSQLGRSFSIMAESRQLVTTGPYRWVRHPLYLAEELAMIGVFIQFASLWTALILIIQIAFQLRRIHNEEAILNTTFPEYASYQQTTFGLIPGVY